MVGTPHLDLVAFLQLPPECRRVPVLILGEEFSLLSSPSSFPPVMFRRQGIPSMAPIARVLRVVKPPAEPAPPEPTSPIVEERRAICASCPNNKLGYCVDATLPTGEHRLGCGCAIESKTSNLSSSCPNNLW